MRPSLSAEVGDRRQRERTLSRDPATAAAEGRAVAARKPAAPGQPERLYLLDGSGYIFRAYHVLPPLTRKDGTPVGCVLGFCNMLWKLAEEALADARFSHIAVIFDSGRVTFRNDIYPAYKANRPATPEDLIPQFPLVREGARAFNLACIEEEGFEADDVIASYAKAARDQGIEVVIVSSDKDLMQLVGEGISLFDPMKLRPIGVAEVIEKFGVPPGKVPDVQALAGDSTDNVPGIPGIGVKTAAQLISAYGDLETLLEHAAEIPQPKRREALLHAKVAARLSRQLVTLRDDVPLRLDFSALRFRQPEAQPLLDFLGRMEFNRLADRVRARLSDSGELFRARAGASPGHAVDANGGKADPARAGGGAEGNYALVQTIGDLKAWIALAEAAGEVAVDTETTSLEPMRAELVGISLAVRPHEACYIPLGHRAPDAGGLALEGAVAAPLQIPMAEALDLLRPMLENPAILKIGQNIKYDMQIFARLGIQVAPIDDTMLMSYVLDGGRHGHGMDELSRIHLGHETITYKEVAGRGKAAVTFNKVALDQALRYAAEDADVTLRLHQLFRRRLLDERLLGVYQNLERRLVPVIAAMEMAGIAVDPMELARLSREFASRMAELEAEIFRLAGSEFNIASPKQLGEILFEQMGLPGGKKGKTGAYGTGADVLEGLAALGHDLPARVLDWRQLAKLKSTYTDTLPEKIVPTTGRVHTSFAMAATSTGRLASSDPNLQNIPVRTETGRMIRRAFVAPKGYRLLSADYSQIELRLLAHIADIETLRQAFRDNVDIHALTASQVFNTPLKDMDPMVRRAAKAINFGIIYGMSAFGLSQQLGIPQGEAQAYIEAYFKRYPGIRDYMDRTKRLCREQGYVTTLFGRRCHIPGIAEKSPARRGLMERAAINAPIQGSAADVIKRAMIRMPKALQGAGLKARLLLQVHDELIFEVPEPEVEPTAALVKTVMESAAQISVPLIVEVGVARDWASAH